MARAMARPTRWKRDEDHLGALAADSEYAVAVFLAQVADVRAGGFEDPQAQQSEHGDEGEVTGAGGFAAGGEHGFELQVGESQGR